MISPEFKLRVLRAIPFWIQDYVIGAYNSRLYRQRHGGRYGEMREYFKKWQFAAADELAAESNARLEEFLAYVRDHSSWYSQTPQGGLSEFPLLEKASLLQHLPSIRTVSERDGLISLTGGTTGASMKVVYEHGDMQERFALLDHFRESHGYRLGEKVAWFSGKSLATQRDVDRGRCYRDDRRNNIRFFSTFLINRRNFDSYWNALQAFRPRFIVGFPSSVLDIAMVARERGLVADWKVEVMFPTAETVLPVHREVIGEVFGCRLVDQYASSEGAPFILECTKGRLHIHPLTGVFEVLDETGQAAREGEMVVTSFTTRGTPLVRYRVGDRLRLAASDDSCDCGWNFPLVDWIDGRTSDFIYSPETGRINQGNLSNCTKDVDGIFSFQVLQDVEDEITVRVVGDGRFDANQKDIFLTALRERTGQGMRIRLEQVDEIPREPSGKFRFVKNSIASLVG